MTASLYRLPVQMLGDLVSPRALERILQDAAQARGIAPGDLDAPTLEDILKREVFKRLQLSVPAPLAKKRVSEVLDELMRAPQEREMAQVQSLLPVLEEQIRRFTLYFDWPETQRLRSVLGIARQEEQAGRDIGPLLAEGQGLIAQLERRLQEGLVEQGQDLAELQAAFTRVQGLGNREVRRLESLIAQIDEAQKEGTLLPGEVERAQNITFSLRKLLESSVVQQVSSGETVVMPPLAPDAQARVLALEQQHAAQQLTGLEREFAPLLRVNSDQQFRLIELRAQQQGGTLTPATVEEWRESLKLTRDALLAEQRAQFMALEQEVAQLATGLDMGANVRVLLDATHHTLGQGQLVSDELRELRAMRDSLSAALNAGNAGADLAAQQELLEIERAARNVPGASHDMAALLEQAQTQLSRGEAVDLGALWNVLERHMGAAAQQREDFDVRADHVIHEYDAVRNLAGETIQRLGRLADTLRAQRRLGPMSMQARERYELTLTEAESLLQEAKAEYRAAQEVTSTFGEDALSGLLDVFELTDTEGADHTDGKVLGLGDFVEPSAPALSGTASPAPSTNAFQFDFASLSASSASNAPQVAAQAVGTDSWEVQSGILHSGPSDGSTTPLTLLLMQADELHLTHLTMQAAQYTWEAKRSDAGRWLITRKTR